MGHQIQHCVQGKQLHSIFLVGPQLETQQLSLCQQAGIQREQVVIASFDHIKMFFALAHQTLS